MAEVSIVKWILRHANFGRINTYSFLARLQFPDSNDYLRFSRNFIEAQRLLS